MKVRLINNHDIIGFADTFNLFSVAEVTFYCNEYMDSEYIKDLEIMIYGIWLNLNLVFRNNDVITDNYNTCFFKPRNWNDRKQGYED